MAARSATSYLTEFLRNRQRFSEELNVPVLLWEAGAPGDDPDSVEMGITEGGQGKVARAPTPGETLVFELRKIPNAKNPFAMGVTVGRIGQNDIGLEDASVSRFHAWFQESPQGWVICDAESKNGTTLDGRKLIANQKTPLRDGAELKIGDVRLRFLLPKSFAEWLRRA